MSAQENMDLRRIGMASAFFQGGSDKKTADGSGDAFLQVLSQARRDTEEGRTLMSGSAAVGRLPEKQDFQGKREASPVDKPMARRERDDKAPRSEARAVERKQETRQEDRREPVREAESDRPARDDQVADRAGSRGADDREDKGPRQDSRYDDGNDIQGAGNQAAEEKPAAAKQAGNDVAPQAAVAAETSGTEEAMAGAMEAAMLQQAAQPAAGKVEARPKDQPHGGQVKAAAKAGEEKGADLAALAQAGSGAEEGEAEVHGQAAQARPEVRNQGQQGQMQAQAQAADQAQMNAAAVSAVQGGERVARQAADLSAKIGAGKDVAIEVQVDDAAAGMFSKPQTGAASASLLASDAGSEGRGGLSQGQPGMNGVNPQLIAQQATQQQAAAGQPQTFQAAVQSAGQAQAAGAIEGAKAAAPTPMAMANPQATPGGEAPNALPQAGQTAQSQQASQSQATQQPRFTIPGQNVADQVSVQITKALQNGNDRISINLRPEELGRIEVKMELNHDGRVTAVVTADHQSTLDLLKRDAGDLHKALNDAGLKMDSGDLSFNLREQPRQEARNEGGSGRNPYGSGALDSEPETPAASAGLLAQSQGGMTADGRLDIRA